MHQNSQHSRDERHLTGHHGWRMAREQHQNHAMEKLTKRLDEIEAQLTRQQLVEQVAQELAPQFQKREGQSGILAFSNLQGCWLAAMQPTVLLAAEHHIKRHVDTALRNACTLRRALHTRYTGPHRGRVLQEMRRRQHVLQNVAKCLNIASLTRGVVEQLPELRGQHPIVDCFATPTQGAFAWEENAWKRLKNKEAEARGLTASICGDVCRISQHNPAPHSSVHHRKQRMS